MKLSLRNLSFLLAAAPLTACIAESSGITQSAEGCPELTPGGTIGQDVKVDVKVRAFMQATADLKAISDKLKVAVKTACVNVAKDLGADDTWSAMGDSDDAIANSKGTGACDAARAKITAIMQSDAAAKANFALVISRGACHPDFKAEADCEAGCSTQTKCDPGTVETRCEPGHLSVQCQAACAAQAYCEGRVEVEANCNGSCEATCHGKCMGSCFDEHGRQTDNDEACHGKCTGSCVGKCTGHCKIEVEEGIQCGERVACTGGCKGTYTDPVCETEFTPPSCMLDTSCFESCRTSVSAKAVCDPPEVTLTADVSVSADVQKLVTTVNANLPALVAIADEQGKIVVAAGERIVVTGQAVIESSGSLDGHSIACAAAAGKWSSEAVASLHVSAQAGVDVTQSCSSHAK